MPAMEICLECTFMVTGNALVSVEAETIEQGMEIALTRVKADPRLFEMDSDSLRSAAPQNVRAYAGEVLEEPNA